MIISILLDHNLGDAHTNRYKSFLGLPCYSYSVRIQVLTPGAELLEIRHQAGYRQFIEAPTTLFVFLTKDPHQCLHVKSTIELMDIEQYHIISGQILGATHKSNPFNSLVTV